MAAEVVRMRTIQRVMREFLDARARTLEPSELEVYRETIAQFENRINTQWARARGARRATEIFGPERIPGEMRDFIESFVGTSGPTVLADLCSWLVSMDYVPEPDLEDAIDSIGALFLEHTTNPLNA